MAPSTSHSPTRVILFLVLAVVAGMAASAAAVSTPSVDCFDVLSKGGATSKFGGNVAHAIHSMTVEVLRRFFEPSATVNNSIPTIAMDLHSEDPILNNAPEAPASPFMTAGMQTVDRVLNHWDNKYYDVKGFTILERVLHAYHMQEVWAMVRKFYLQFKQTPPSRSICPCATDVDNNGIMKALRFTALAMREPELVYGKAYTGYYVPYSVTYHFGATNKFDTKAPLSEKSVLMKDSDGMPALVDEASWKKWKSLLLSMDPAAHKDVALYLFCALN